MVGALGSGIERCHDSQHDLVTVNESLQAQYRPHGPY